MNYEEEYKKLQKAHKALQQEVDGLRDKVRRLELSLKNASEEDPFVEAHGVLWKRSPGGSFEHALYCKDCRLVMTPFPSDYPTYFRCTQCGSRVEIKQDDLPVLIRELAGGS